MLEAQEVKAPTAFRRSEPSLQKVEKERDYRGRVLVRYSGTQQQCRVIVEELCLEDAKNHCTGIELEVKKNLA